MALARRICGLWGIAAIIAVLVAAPARAQSPKSWSAELYSTAYLSRSELPVPDEDQTSVVQGFAAQTHGWFDGRLSARFNGRLADDWRSDREIYEPGRLYTGYLQLRLPTRRTQMRLGRQFLHEGASWLSFDGLHLETNLSPRLRLHGWAGAPSRRELDFQFEDPGKRSAFGARLVARIDREFDAAVGWSRTDRSDVVLRQPVEGEVGWHRQTLGSVRVRASYETERSEMERVEALGRFFLPAPGSMLSVQYVDRKPQLDPDSWFQRFSEYLSRVQVARETLVRRWENGYGGEIEALQSFTGEQSSGNVGFAVLGPHFRVGYARTYGDRAEGDRFYGNVNYLVRPWWRVGAGAAASKYEFLYQEPSPDQRDLVTSYLRSNFSVHDWARLRVEMQTVDRPGSQGDVRLLVGLDLRAHGNFATDGGEG